ncbi:MAG TPA: galactosyltransferase-related protein [Candidatus Limnocylindrales bacterium]|nr:galactosyltransferase-related protein [Candidatus Limnocylindrales bacterium]
MKAVVLVPWRGGNDHRERSWAFVEARWRELGLPIVTGDAPGSFSRAASRNLAAELAGDWDVALFVDADTLVRDPGPVREALELAHRTGKVVIPHDEYVGLSANGTALLLAGQGRGWQRILRRVAGAPLGVIAVPRVAWETLGGFDERFSGWGGEDVAFARAARTLVGVVRLPGQIWHLWHPRDTSKAAYLEGPKELTARYGAAVGDVAAMRALLDERQAVAA